MDLRAVLSELCSISLRGGKGRLGISIALNTPRKGRKGSGESGNKGGMGRGRLRGVVYEDLGVNESLNSQRRKNRLIIG